LWVRWRLEGRAQDLRNLKIHLEARRFQGVLEVAKELRSRQSDRERPVLQSLPVFETSDPDVMQCSEWSFVLPRGLRSEYRSKDVWVAWRLVFEGRTDRRLRLEREYDLSLRRRGWLGRPRARGRRRVSGRST
jgi:hypothetical protein